MKALIQFILVATLGASAFAYAQTNREPINCLELKGTARTDCFANPRNARVERPASEVFPKAVLKPRSSRLMVKPKPPAK